MRKKSLPVQRAFGWKVLKDCAILQLYEIL
jgi:hypothetical protein